MTGRDATRKRTAGINGPDRKFYDNRRRLCRGIIGRDFWPQPGPNQEPDGLFKVLTQKGYFYAKPFIITPAFAHCNNFVIRGAKN